MSLSMSLADMRSFIREHMDSDSEELPDSLLDRFLYNGSNRVEQYSRAWDFRAVEYAFTTTASDGQYDLDAQADLITPAPLADVVAIQGDSYELKPADHRKMRVVYTPNSTTGSPLYFSKWGRSLYLWPAPSSEIDYTVIGYRQPLDWIATNASPDFPDDLHELIAWWALNRTYVFLDDPELADFYRSEFDRELKIRGRQYLTGLDAQPFIVNGGLRMGGSVPWANRARYDWE